MKPQAGTISKTLLILLLCAALAVVAGCSTMQKDIRTNQTSIDQLTKQNAELANRVDELENTVGAMDDQVMGDGGIAQACQNYAAQSKRIDQIARTQSYAYKKKQLLLKVKVLAGDDDLLKARRAAKQLEKHGYSVRVVDVTPEPRFKHVTIYYATGFKDEAKLMSKVLSRKSTLRPLTWNSVFDVIVVTAGK